jgi:predicted ATPase/DNA-binding SARP family transcriptional activator/Flp pilus assembly protein TadD
LALYLFGAPRIEREGAPVEVGRRKALALLAYLAATRQSHTRETLAALLWPEYEPASAKGEVRRALSAIRKMLGDGWLDADREVVRLNDGLWLDVAQFQRLLQVCQQHGHPPSEVCLACRDPLTEAAALAQDEFMAGFTLPDSPAFDDWQSYEREGLRRDLAGVLERLARLLGRTAEESTEQAIGYARRWLALDPLDEAAHRLLMQLYARSGQRQAALQQYQECVQLLESELGLPPTDETTALVERIRSGELAEESTVQAPPVLTTPPAHNLPALTTPFIGRKDELEEIEALLGDPECRLLTVIGPGGMGKTRLVLETAHRTAERGRFTNGVYLAGLAPVSSPAFLASSIAASLSLQLQGSSDPQAQLLQFLRQKEMLLVLDNFEHLLEGATLLSDILHSAPHVTMLVTSRERLALRAETILPLEGLPFPSGEAVERAEEFSAVQLFVESAQRVERGFKLTTERRAWVVRICQLVQGLPLAIELAAAWVRALSCEEIAREIEQDLDFLSGTMRDLPERHRSLRAVFEHSWRLLSEEERRVFRRLAVFRGGFLREAAEQVAGATLAILSTLVDKSFLVRDGKRYGRHTLLWQFANEKLSKFPGEEARVRDAHSEYYATFLAQRETALMGGGQKEAQEQIRADLENVRVAWQWMVEQGRVAALDRSLKGLSLFYAFTGLRQEGEAAMEMALRCIRERAGTLEHLTPDARRLLGRLLAEQAHHLVRQAMFERGKAVAQEAIAQARASRDAHSEAVAQLWLGEALLHQGKYEPALTELRKTLVLARSARLLSLEADSLLALGRGYYHAGDYRQTRAHYDEALERYRQIGDRRGEGETLSETAGLMQYEGDYAGAKPYSEQALHIARELGNQAIEADALIDLGNIAVDRGYCVEARERYEQALPIFRRIGDRRSESIVLVNLGLTLIFLGEYAEAQAVLDEVVPLARSIGDRRIEGIGLLNLSHLFRHLGNGEKVRHYLDEALAIQTAIANRRSTALVLAYLGLFAYHQGRHEAALSYSEQSVKIAQEHGDRHVQAYALNHLGHALLAVGRDEEATSAYEEALALRRALGQPALAMEVLAGMIRVAQARDDAAHARTLVEEILAHLEGGNLDGSDEPLRVYLTCYQVLQAKGNARAGALLERAHSLLYERAARLDDVEARCSFLENVAAHREIVAEWEARQG